MARSTRVQLLLLKLRRAPWHSMPVRREPPTKRRALAWWTPWLRAARLRAF